MENKYADDTPDSSEQDVVFEEKQYKVAVKEKHIVLQLFKQVFVDFFVEIFTGVFGFFKRYILLIWNCIKFLWKPNADEHTKANAKTITNAKETFEFILIITGITLFLIKQNWMESTDELKEIYGNDLGQYATEFTLFILYSLAFFIVMIVLILLGRLLRLLFKAIEPRDVTDKVFINLNNIFFIVTIIYSFVRKFDPYNATDLQNIEPAWYAIWFVTYAIPLAVIVFLFFYTAGND